MVTGVMGGARGERDGVNEVVTGVMGGAKGGEMELFQSSPG